MNKFFLFISILCFSFSNAQELNCTVRVNAGKLTNSDLKIFKTLETSLNELVNKTIWTTNEYKPNEKINCSMTINLDSYDSDQFSGSMQIQSSRPAYNSTYTTPIFNYNDKNCSFRYLEFENLLYNPTSFESNIVSMVSFYSFMIIALDQDTFSKNAGAQTYELAQNVANIAQSSSYKGWSQNDGNQNRYYLINDILSSTYSPFRDALYDYNFLGIDNMEKNPKSAKEKIILALNELRIIHDIRPNSFLMRVFFDAKSDEIVSLFSGGPKIQISDLIDNLNRISPMNSIKWNQIRN